MEDETPRVRVAAVLLIGLLLAAHICLRYELRWGYHKKWQALHVGVGLAYVAGVLVLFHGTAILRRFDRRARIILGLGVTCYVLFWYWGRGDTYVSHVREWVPQTGPLAPIFPFIYLSVSALVLRLVIPFTLGARLVGVDPRRLGLWSSSGPPDKRVRWVYVALFVGLLPVLLVVAESPAFLQKYPLARGMLSPGGTIAWEHFLGYQAFYLLVFVSGEALYRGFFTFGLEKQLGLYGIAFMLVPYVCSHFGKPLPETLGAILAGSLLAFLALKHRSVWLGVGLHYAVALTMDVLAIRGNGFELT